MKLYTTTESKHAIFNGDASDYTFAHVEARLKKKGKSSLRMKQAENTNFMQGEVIDIRDELKAQRNAERNAKRKCYKY